MEAKKLGHEHAPPQNTKLLETDRRQAQFELCRPDLRLLVLQEYFFWVKGTK